MMKKMMKYLLAITTMLCLVLAFSGCGKSNGATQEDQVATEAPAETSNQSTPEASADNGQAENGLVEEGVQPIATTPVAKIVVKDYGTITLELEPEMAPNTVNNFITLANDGFYDGLIFHRVIKDFMIQGGDPEGTGVGGPGYSIVGEFADNGYTQNTLSHEKGVISMARTMDPNTAGSQFFITSGDSTFLDGQYAAFGKVTSGLDVVDAIQKVQTDDNDRPTKDVVIESIKVETNGAEVPGVVKTENK